MVYRKSFLQVHSTLDPLLLLDIHLVQEPHPHPPFPTKKTHTLSITSEVTNLKDHLYQETIWDLIVYIPISQSSKSVPITANAVIFNPAQARCTRYKHYVIKFVSDMRQVCVFLRVLRFPPQIKLSATI